MLSSRTEVSPQRIEAEEKINHGHTQKWNNLAKRGTQLAPKARVFSVRSLSPLRLIEWHYQDHDKKHHGPDDGGFLRHERRHESSQRGDEPRHLRPRRG